MREVYLLTGSAGKTEGASKFAASNAPSDAIWGTWAANSVLVRLTLVKRHLVFAVQAATAKEW